MFSLPRIGVPPLHEQGCVCLKSSTTVVLHALREPGFRSAFHRYLYCRWRRGTMLRISPVRSAARSLPFARKTQTLTQDNKKICGRPASNRTKVATFRSDGERTVHHIHEGAQTKRCSLLKNMK